MDQIALIMSELHEQALQTCYGMYYGTDPTDLMEQAALKTKYSTEFSGQTKKNALHASVKP